MTVKALCPSCARLIAFDSDQTPAQRSWSRRKPRQGQILAYYPTCPHCNQKVEVTATRTPLANAGMRTVG